MDVAKAILAFRRGPYFRWFYVLVLALTVSAMIPLIQVCVGVLMIPIVMFALPYWLKERSLKWYALNGAVVLVVAALIFAAFDAQTFASSTPGFVGRTVAPVSITNGTVSPGRGLPGSFFNFTAVLTDGSGRNPSDFTMHLNLTQLVGLDPLTRTITMLPVDNDADLTDGKRYYANLTVEDRIYFFWFATNYTIGSQEIWLETPFEIGPIVTGFGSFFGLALYIAFGSLLIPVSFYYLILMLYWYTQRAKIERQRLGLPTSTPGDTGFMCTNCGADVPADADRCPKCGAEFEPEREELPEEEPEAEGSTGAEDADAKP